jgi:hypothetical protein
MGLGMELDTDRGLAWGSMGVADGDVIGDTIAGAADGVVDGGSW